MRRLTNVQIVNRINRWSKKPKVHVPTCYHPEYHGFHNYNGRGRMKAVLHNGKPALMCTNPRCASLLPTDGLPRTAFAKNA